MHEKEVEEIVAEYLRKEKPQRIIVLSNVGVDMWDPGIEIGNSEINIGAYEGIHIECKGSYSNIDRAIGQCLRYHFEKHPRNLYIAIPEDHKQLQLMINIFDLYNLPVGIMTVSSNRQVMIARKTQNKL